MEPQAQRRTPLSPSNGGQVRPRGGLNHPVVQDVLGKGSLCTVLVEHLSEGREPAAFDYLFRETSLETLNHCLSEIRDQEVANYLLDSLLLIAALLSSGAFIGIERNRIELKTLMVRSGDDLAKARRKSSRSWTAVRFPGAGRTCAVSTDSESGIWRET